MLFMRVAPRRCYWCGVRLTRGGTGRPTSATKDHLTPKSRGGNSRENKVPCCYRCNNRKGDMTAEEYVVYLQAR